jgi:hypothetical protein
VKPILFLAVLLGLCAGRLVAAPPPNDAFQAATVMQGSSWLTSGTLFGATSEANEPVLTGFPNGPTVWWRWQAPTTGLVRLRTWGSEADNILAVYRGSTLDTTRLVAFGSSHFERANAAEVRFNATAGETYTLQVLGADYASPVFITDPFLPARLQLSLIYVSSPTPPANDTFAQARVLSGNTADVVVSVVGAGAEPGEPLDLPDAQQNTVWLTWTAPASGVWQMDAQQCDFDNLIAVYTGSSVAQLVRLDAADQAYVSSGNPFAGGGRVTFGVTAGQRYHFQVQGAVLPGAPFEQGNVRLLLQPVAPPPNDDFADATLLTGASPSAEGYNTFAHREGGEPPAPVDEGRSIWWRWVAPTTGILAVVQHDGTLDVYQGASLSQLVPPPHAPNPGSRSSLGGLTDWYAVTAGQTLWLRGRTSGDHIVFSLRTVQSPANDDFANRRLLTGPVVEATVDLEYASWERDEPRIDGFGPQTAWFRWVAPASQRFVLSTDGSPSFTRLDVFTGTAINALTRAGTEALYGFSPHAYGRVILEAVAGTEYAIQLRRESVVTGLDRLHIRPANPPANDAFASAILKEGSSWTTSGTNADATDEPNEPFTSLSDNPTGASVWWRWVAPASGIYRVSTAGSKVNTVLSVYTGSTLGGLIRAGQNQDAGWGSTGALNLLATAGTTYHIQVDGQAREEGSIQLSVAPLVSPPNDSLAGRLPLAGGTSAAGGTVLGASLEPGEPAPSGASGGRSVWYEWVAAASGPAFFQVTAARFNPAFALYQGSSIDSLFPGITGGSGAATGGEQTFLASYPVSKGTRYQLRIEGGPVDNGDFRLSISQPSAPANDAFASRTVLAGNVVRTSANNEGATSQPGEPLHAGSSARFSVWWEWTAPTAGPVTLDTAGSTAQARLAVYTGAALNALVPVASGPVTFPPGFSTVNFQATAGTRYLIAADTGDRSRGDIALNLVSGAAVPVNDAWANATRWTGDQAEDLVRPTGASAEPGEPAHGGRPAARSLWWAWTPRTTRRALVWMETEQPSLLARIAIYKGTALNSLTPVTALATDVRWNRLEVDVLAGETYYLALDTLAAEVDPGWIQLGVAPANGTRSGAAPIEPADGYLSVRTDGATTEDPSLAPSALGRLWWFWVADVNARMEWQVLSSQPDATDLSVGSSGAFFGTLANATSGRVVPGTGELVGTFDAVAGTAYLLQVNSRTAQTVSVRLAPAIRQVPPNNDQPYRAQIMSGASWNAPLTLGGESGNRLWWHWTAPSAGVAEVRLTGSLAEDDALLAFADGTVVVTAGTRHSNGGPPVLRISSRAGQQWWFATQTQLRRLRPATLSLVSPAPGNPPANDSWTTPQVLPAQWTSASGDVSPASCEPGELDHSASGGTQVATLLPPGRSVWFEWTPTEDGWVALRLDSKQSLALRVYRGRTLDEYQSVGFLQPESRLLNVYLLAGQTYHLAVASRPYEERTASFILRRGPAAPNDAFALAALLAGKSAFGQADSQGATAEPGEPGHGFNFAPARASLWWKWTAPATGLVALDTRGSEFDTILAVFASDPPDATSRVAENQNAGSRPGLNASAVVFPAVGGQTYFIRVCHADADEPTGLARVNLTLGASLDPYLRWVGDYPELLGDRAADQSDPDGDGLVNLAECVFGGNPLQAEESRGALRIAPTEGGIAVEATIARNTLEALYGGNPITVEWQVSRDLRQWQPGPPSRVVGSEGALSIERIVLSPDDPPFVRLLIRRAQ